MQIQVWQRAGLWALADDTLTLGAIKKTYCPPQWKSSHLRWQLLKDFLHLSLGTNHRTFEYSWVEAFSWENLKICSDENKVLAQTSSFAVSPGKPPSPPSGSCFSTTTQQAAFLLLYMQPLAFFSHPMFPVGLIWTHTVWVVRALPDLLERGSR